MNCLEQFCSLALAMFPSNHATEEDAKALEDYLVTVTAQWINDRFKMGLK